MIYVWLKLWLRTLRSLYVERLIVAKPFSLLVAASHGWHPLARDWTMDRLGGAKSKQRIPSYPCYGSRLTAGEHLLKLISKWLKQINWVCRLLSIFIWATSRHPKVASHFSSLDMSGSSTISLQSGVGSTPLSYFLHHDVIVAMFPKIGLHHGRTHAQSSTSYWQ